MDYATWALSIFGTGIAVAAFVVSYMTYNFLRPKLYVKVESCTHYYMVSEMFPPEMELRFTTVLEIRNCGDKGTTLSDIELSYSDNGKKYVLKNEMYGKQTEGTDSWGEKIIQVERRWVNSFEILKVNPTFVEFMGNRKDQKEKIDCLFTFISTYKNYKAKFTSKKVHKGKS